MSLPNFSQIHVNKPLTNISIAYLQDRDAFIAGKVFPFVPVQKQADQYFKYNPDDWFRDEVQERAPATESQGSGYELSTDTYFCRRYSFHKDLTPENIANADAPLNLEAEATRFVTEKLLLQREVLWGTRFFADGVWTNQLDGVASNPGAGEVLQWDATNGTPIQDIHDAQATVLALRGTKLNTLVIGYDVYNKLRNLSVILERIQYVQPAVGTLELIANLFDVERVYVSYAVVNSAAQGATESTGFVLGKHALLCHVPDSPGLLTPTAGYTFTWNGLLGSDGFYGTRIRTLEMPLRDAYRVEADMAYDMKVVDPLLGYFFKDIVS